MIHVNKGGSKFVHAKHKNTLCSAKCDSDSGISDEIIL